MGSVARLASWWWSSWLVDNMGSLLSALSSWRPTLGAGTYTILGDTNGLFERYLTEPGTSSSSVPSLTELPSLIVAQLLPEVALGSKGPARRIPDAPRLSPQLASNADCSSELWICMEEASAAAATISARISKKFNQADQYSLLLESGRQECRQRFEGCVKD